MARIRKIILLTETKFSQRDYDRFGVEVMNKNGFIVKIWELTPFLHKKFFSELGESEFKHHEQYKLFYYEKDILQSIGKLDESYFIICLLGYNLETYPIYKAISRNKIPYGVFLANALPEPENKFSKAKIKRALALLIHPSKIFKKLENLLFFNNVWKFTKINSARLALLGGEKSFSQYSKFFPINQQTAKLWLHSLDYDLYLKEKNAPLKPAEEKIAVFLDEYIPFHPDYLLMDSLPFSRAEEYYPSLCRFFTYLENKLRVKTVIAAHPRSDYDKHPDYFEGRQVIKGKTVELIRNSQLVITHSSTSANMAVLFQKSIVFVTTERLSKSPQGPFINIMAQSLGKRVINIDNNCDIFPEEDLKINPAVYIRYKNEYIKKDNTEELFFWQIFTNYLIYSDQSR